MAALVVATFSIGVVLWRDDLLAGFRVSLAWFRTHAEDILAVFLCIVKFRKAQNHLSMHNTHLQLLNKQLFDTCLASKVGISVTKYTLIGSRYTIYMVHHHTCHIYSIFNFWTSTWCITNIIPVLKMGYKWNVNNYRLISLTFVHCKVLAYTIASWLTEIGIGC